MYKQREEAIVFDSKTRLIAIPLLIALLLSAIFPEIFNLLVGLVLPSTEEQTVSLASFVEMVLSISMCFLLILWTSKLKFKDIGLETKGAFFKILIGIACGFATISTVTFLINIFGGVQTSYTFEMKFLPHMILGLVFFAIQGTYEELIYRGYLMPHFSKAMGIVPSILLTAMLFTVLHALNPGMTIMPVINLMLAGIVFSLAYYLTGSLWLVGFSHGVWNYSQSFIYGSSVSGLNTQGTVFKAVAIENQTLISGGIFGFEGSVITSIVGVAIIITLIIKIKNKI
ncbi:MAG: CPBP family intramembrane metalloprotease [Campylobacteraceae bacterium]|nr:CPBP family intramembrane metalloprotease [Campylobacteraceae bacterium]